MLVIITSLLQVMFYILSSYLIFILICIILFTVAARVLTNQGTISGVLYLSRLISDAFFFLLILAEINCWQDWLVFSDIFFFLMKSGCIDFVDFVDKLVSRVTEGDQHILRTNHVTWLLAQIMRVELVMNALNSDARKVVS